jgi:hypothetical protein
VVAERPVPQSISVRTNAQVLQEEHAFGLQELQLLQKMLGSIDMMGCVDCWFKDPHAARTPLPHDHQYSRMFQPSESALRSKQIPPITHWPFCYLCWVPFRSPCFHPPHRKGVPAKTEDCPYPNTLPRLTALIWHDQDMRCQVESALGIKAETFKPFSSFTEWLFTPESTADRIPRQHQFILAYYRLYHSE